MTDPYTKPNLRRLTTEQTIDAAFDAIKQGFDLLRSLLAHAESGEDFILAVSARDVLKKLHGELDAAMSEAAVEFLQATDDGAVQNETTRWYVGSPKTTRQVATNAKLVEAVWSAVGGDVEAFAACLSSGCFKPAATRTALGDDTLAQTAWSVTYPDKLKEGKPQKKLVTLPVKLYEELQAKREAAEKEGADE